MIVERTQLLPTDMSYLDFVSMVTTAIAESLCVPATEIATDCPYSWNVSASMGLGYNLLATSDHFLTDPTKDSK